MVKTKLIFLSIFLFSTSSFGGRGMAPTGNAQKPCPHDDANRREKLAAERQVASIFQSPERRGESAESVDSNSDDEKKR